MHGKRGAMRVLMTADTVGGVWHYAIGLARGLAVHDIRTELATMGGPLSTSQRADARQVPGLRLHESRFKLEWMRDPWADVQRAGEWLLRLERRLKPDLIHLNNYAHGALPWNAPVLMVGHSCVLSWFRGVKGRPPTSEWAPYRRSVRAGLHAATQVVAPSRAMLDALTCHYGPLRRAMVIYNGRDPDRFAPAVKEAFVFAAGRLWDEAKNIAVAAEAAPGMRWPLRIAGERHHPDGGSARFRNVELLGVLDAGKMADRYARASIFLHPAGYEPFGLSVVEAGLSGCALVLGDIPSLRELWGDAALFVPPRDPQAVTEAVNRLIAEPVRRQLLARRARNRALQFTLERTTAAYLAVYRALSRMDGTRTASSRDAERERSWTTPSRS